MLVGVLSDTHLPSLARGRSLLERLATGPFRDVSIILHAGDLVNPMIMGAFPDKTVYAVRGNLDPPDPQLPIKRVIVVEGRRIGLIHGWGAPTGMAERVLREFNGEHLDVLVFGHSHQPYCQSHNGVLLFNPGSATDRRGAPNHTVGLLDLGPQVAGRILPIDKLLSAGR